MSWEPGLGAVIYVEISAEDLKERKPIETAAKRKFDKEDTWSAHNQLWFRWTNWNGGRTRYEYQCREDDLRAFQANPQPCTLRYERLKK